MKSPKQRKIKVDSCVLCGTEFFSNEAREMANICLWIHIFRRDKYFRALDLPHKPKRPVAKRPKQL